MLLVAVSLTVAAVPEALPVCVTICLARGMLIMAKEHQAQILKLKSVETLGNATVICTDKTGTLTKGEMTAVRMWFGGQVFRFTGAGFDPRGYVIPESMDTQDDRVLQKEADDLKGGAHSAILIAAALCSNATLQFNEKEQKWETKGNSSERPLIVAARKGGFDKAALEKSYPKLKENAFNSARKMMSTFHEVKDSEHDYFSAKFISCVKGAPNYILKNCSRIATAEKDYKSNGPIPTRGLEEKEKTEILEVIDRFSAQAYRVLAVASRSFDSAPAELDSDATVIEKGLTLLGLVCVIDPERPEVMACIEEAFRAGVRTVMITGDYVATAKAIAENIGIIPRNSDATKAVDCERLRVMGDEEEKLLAREKDLEEKKDPKKAFEERKKAAHEKGIELEEKDEEPVQLTVA